MKRTRKCQLGPNEKSVSKSPEKSMKDPCCNLGKNRERNLEVNLGGILGAVLAGILKISMTESRK